MPYSFYQALTNVHCNNLQFLKCFHKLFQFEISQCDGVHCCLRVEPLKSHGGILKKWLFCACVEVWVSLGACFTTIQKWSNMVSIDPHLINKTMNFKSSIHTKFIYRDYMHKPFFQKYFINNKWSNWEIHWTILFIRYNIFK